MRLAIFALTALLFMGCERREPKMTEAQLQRLRSSGVSDGCVTKAKWRGFSAVLPESCIDRLPPMHLRGLFRNDFEAPLFCPEPATQCRNSVGPKPSGIWFELDSRPPVLRDSLPGGLYAVDFIGRRTVHGTPYALFAQDVIVDRLISIRQVEPPPK